MITFSQAVTNKSVTNYGAAKVELYIFSMQEVCAFSGEEADDLAAKRAHRLAVQMPHLCSNIYTVRKFYS